jgi:ribonuclease R
LNNIESKIINFLLEKDKPVKLNELLKETDIDTKNLKQSLKSLIKDGQIIKLKSNKYCLTKNLDVLTGYLDGHPDGYAFFVPDDESMEDIFVPPKKMNGAVHKDRVAVRIEYFRNKKEARVVKILERGYRKVVGRVEKSAHFAHVIPFVKKLFNDIYIPKKYSKNLKDNDVVLCEIVFYPQGGKNPEGKILKVLGNLSDKGIENEIVLSKYELDRNFPPAVIKEVDKTAQNLLNNPGKRTDFKKLFTVTIDGETARDFDDAISLEKSDDGYILYVHIADVAHFVRPNTRVDIEAYKRGTSVYFPEFAIPMLPEKLSNELCSLRPDEVKLTLTAKIFYNKNGERVKLELYQSTIKSNYRLTYNYVNDIIEGKEKTRSKPLKNLLSIAVELTNLLIEKRKRQGTIDFDLPEPEFIFDKNGDLVDIQPLERKLSHRIIENFMIEANEAVSEYLENLGVVSVYRVHDKPSAVKVREFLNVLSTFGISVDLPDEITPKTIQEIASKFEDNKFGYILNSLLVKTMEKAIYDTKNIGHFGLASKSYTHFTSPIRRYPDLVIHRLIKNALFEYPYDIPGDFVEKATKQSSETEQRAEDAEREIHQFKKLKFLENNKGTIYEAYINRLNSGGMFVFIPKLIMGGFIPLSSLDDDFYSYFHNDNIIIGKKTRKTFKVGDRLKVSLLRVNYDYLEADFQIETDDNAK